MARIRPPRHMKASPRRATSLTQRGTGEAGSPSLAADGLAWKAGSRPPPPRRDGRAVSLAHKGSGFSVEGSQRTPRQGTAIASGNASSRVVGPAASSRRGGRPPLLLGEASCLPVTGRKPLPPPLRAATEASRRRSAPEKKAARRPRLATARGGGSGVGSGPLALAARQSPRLEKGAAFPSWHGAGTSRGARASCGGLADCHS